MRLIDKKYIIAFKKACSYTLCDLYFLYSVNLFHYFSHKSIKAKN